MCFANFARGKLSNHNSKNCSEIRAVLNLAVEFSIWNFYIFHSTLLRVVMNTNDAHHSWQCYHRWHQKGPCKACVWWFHPVITRWYQLCDSLRDRRQITFDVIIIPSMICKVVFRKWQQTSCPSFLKPTWTRCWERYSSTWILSASEAAGVVSSGTLFDISLKHGIRDWRSHNWAKKEAW